MNRRRIGFWRHAARSFRWVWSAAPREFAVVLGAEVAAAGALALVLLCGRSVAVDLTGDQPPASVADVLPAVAGLAIGLFVSALATMVQREYRLVVGELVVHHLEADIIDVATSVDYERFEQQDFNDLRDRATAQGAVNSLQLVYDVVGLGSSIATTASLVLVLATTVPSILPVLVVVAIPFVIAARASARIGFRAVHELTPDDRLRSSLYWALVGKAEAKEIRVFDLRAPLQRRWSALFDERAARVRDVALRRVVFNGLASSIAALLVAGLLVVIVDAAIDDRIAVADAAIAIVAMQQIAVRIRTTAGSAGSLRQAALFLDDFERFRTMRTSSVSDSAPATRPLDELRVAGVDFRYPGTDRTVLEGIDLRIGAGEIVALVGASGSGKSTLAHLVAGLYRPSAGRITWDGVDIADRPRDEHWRSLAVVYQDFVRYELTARENIGISDHRRLDELTAITEAARRASIDEVVAGLPDGYESMLSRAYDGGVDLSGGEWQRIAVARAFFRDAPLVILDEPAAALDAMAERRLYEQLVELCVDRAALLISHRFSTVRMADRIYVLQHGRVVEHGSHEELVALDGHYAAMFHVQAAGYIDSA